MRNGTTLAILLSALFLMSTLGTAITMEEDTEIMPAAGRDSSDIRISEILVSASSEDYNGTDWNNDGYIGSSSDQFIELWNSGSEPIDVSNWLLDDSPEEGSAPCPLLGTQPLRLMATL